MAAVFNGAGGTSLRSEVAWITGYPASAGAWVQPNQTANPGVIVDFCDALDNAEFILFQGNAALSNGTQFAVFNEDSAGSGTASAAAGTATSGRYVYVLARWISPTNRQIHVYDPVANTVSNAQDTTSIVNSGIIKTSIGVIYASSFASFGGSIGEIFAANIDPFPGGGVPTNQQVMNLAFNGPFSLPDLAQHVTAYWPLKSASLVPDYTRNLPAAPIFTNTAVTFVPGPSLVTQFSQQASRNFDSTMQGNLLQRWMNNGAPPVLGSQRQFVVT